MVVDLHEPLVDVARAAVRRLDDDLDPGTLPENALEWNAALVSAVR